MSETGTAGFILNDHVTLIHSSYLTNQTETKTFSEKKKWQQKRNKHPDVKKMEVLVGHCLRETQVVGIQEAESYLMAQRLRYGDWEDSYLQNRCLANLISTLMPQSHLDVSNDLVSSTKNSQLIK